MGGGDLNLKKSWHPHTMKNQEKVWRAEQAEAAEQRKLNELRQEIIEEKNREDLKKVGQSSGVLAQTDDRKLEWMYKGPTDLLNREDYLLGRAVDKNFEQLEAEEKEEKQKQLVGVTVPKNHVEHECIPFSIRSYRSIHSSEQVDLQRKIMEDPLMLIKQKELESRRRILENPVKLKELHKLLKHENSNTTSTKKKSKKEKKKKDKKVKKKKRRSSEGSSDEELDELLAKQYKKVQGVLGKDEIDGNLDINKLLSAKYDKLTKELDKVVKSKKKKKHARDNSSASNGSDSGSSRSSSLNDRNRKNRDREMHQDRGRRNFKQDGGNTSKERYRGRPDRQSRSRSRSNSRDRPYPPKTELRYRRHNSSEQQNYGLVSRDGQKIEIKNRYIEKKSIDKNIKETPKPDKKISNNNYKKLSDEEKEQRRREMMQNARWRDEERTRTVQKYREEYDKEKKLHETSTFDKGFINKELHKAMSNQKSVESRIKSNINNIQRSSKAMDTNFAKR